jgi:hypothetical protein
MVCNWQNQKISQHVFQWTSASLAGCKAIEAKDSNATADRLHPSDTFSASLIQIDMGIHG